jgi:hypothetical protein
VAQTSTASPAPTSPATTALMTTLNLPSCQGVVGLTGWVQTAGGGWVPPDHPEASRGVCIGR